MGVIDTKLFKTADGMAVQLPKDFGSDADVTMSIDDTGTRLTITAVKHVDPAEAKRRLTEMMARLRELGPIRPIEERAPIEFPDRPGL